MLDDSKVSFVWVKTCGSSILSDIIYWSRFHITISFHTPWKHLKPGSFLIHSRVIERSIGMKWAQISWFFKLLISRKSHMNYWFVIHGSQPTWRSGKSVNYKGIWKLTLFSEKSGNYIREFWLNIREIGKINIFLEKYFSVVNLQLALSPVMHIFMFWNIFLLFLAMSIMLQSGFLCLKIYQYSSVTCLIVVWCIITAWLVVWNGATWHKITLFLF